MEYEVEEGFRNPEDHSMFWEYDTQIFGVDLPGGNRSDGKGVTGTMELQGSVFAAHLIPWCPIRIMGPSIPTPYLPSRPGMNPPERCWL